MVQIDGAAQLLMGGQHVADPVDVDTEELEDAADDELDRAMTRGEQEHREAKDRRHGQGRSGRGSRSRRSWASPREKISTRVVMTRVA
jgi:hypothetical protein